MIVYEFQKLNNLICDLNVVIENIKQYINNSALYELYNTNVRDYINIYNYKYFEVYLLTDLHNLFVLNIKDIIGDFNIFKYFEIYKKHFDKCVKGSNKSKNKVYKNKLKEIQILSKDKKYKSIESQYKLIKAYKCDYKSYDIYERMISDFLKIIRDSKEKKSKLHECYNLLNMNQGKKRQLTEFIDKILDNILLSDDIDDKLGKLNSVIENLNSMESNEERAISNGGGSDSNTKGKSMGISEAINIAKETINKVKEEKNSNPIGNAAIMFSSAEEEINKLLEKKIKYYNQSFLDMILFMIKLYQNIILLILIGYNNIEKVKIGSRNNLLKEIYTKDIKDKIKIIIFKYRENISNLKQNIRNNIKTKKIKKNLINKLKKNIKTKIKNIIKNRLYIYKFENLNKNNKNIINNYDKELEEEFNKDSFIDYIENIIYLRHYINNID